MEVATQNGLKRVTALFMLVIAALFWIITPNANADPQEYITSGEQSLYSENIDNILLAHSTFEEAASLYPSDPVIPENCFNDFLKRDFTPKFTLLFYC